MLPSGDAEGVPFRATQDVSCATPQPKECPDGGIEFTSSRRTVATVSSWPAGIVPCPLSQQIAVYRKIKEQNPYTLNFFRYPSITTALEHVSLSSFPLNPSENRQDVSDHQERNLPAHGLIGLSSKQACNGKQYGESGDQ